MQYIGKHNQPGDKWILVGHSLGGLIARRITPTLRTYGIQVVGILTLAAPHQGAPAAAILHNNARAITNQFIDDAEAGPNYGAHSFVAGTLNFLQDICSLYYLFLNVNYNFAQIYKIPHFLEAARDTAQNWIDLADAADTEEKLVPGNGTKIEKLNSRYISVPHRSVIGAEKSPTIIRWLSELGYFDLSVKEPDMVDFYNKVKQWYSWNQDAYKVDIDLAYAKMLATVGIGALFWYDDYTYFKARYHAWK